MEEKMTHSDNGFFDSFGGKYVAEVLRRPLDELEVAFNEAIKDPLFIKELESSARMENHSSAQAL